ncbi:SusC/RagA family TonB-linked outer membrane protein [Mucilaginibacter sp. UR6-11]|uniref:SusC/RagA family TonB-linked outer membrane protein n=1 Tax=Mucilaginibacter sp. UR6-11 TaxID=1435644 RepID=UPI001E45FFED|nr:SusC/RagA family TonB-linked outer membrane protein [Mucilaginibacter sp. UR6-11]MCC8424400.1 SusC/RagA family TonB-linked outer membrane protein [Mucilaginibacter sp. UR6-11]
MKKLLLVSLCFLVLCVTQVFAQNRTVTGTVTAKDDGLPIPGVTVKIKGASVGVPTDVNGKFSISAPENATLVFSFISYVTQEVSVSGRSVINVTLAQDNKQLTEVVVTALGISRETKSLGYSVAVVKGSEITKSRETNVVQALAGKIAGVNITQSSGTLGGGSKIVIRGATSLSSDVQPIFVIDGLIIDNSAQQLATSNSAVPQGVASIDFGNRAGDINSDDVESISVLKGAAAAALYGTLAKNGAIIITTKRGKKNGPGTIEFNSTTRFDNVLLLPKFQNEYAQGNQGTYNIANTNGWGPKISEVQDKTFPNFLGQNVKLQAYPDNIKNFFKTGHTDINSVAFSGGGESGDYRFGYTNTIQTGIIEQEKLNKNAVSFNSGKTILPGFDVRTTVNYVRTVTDGLPTQSSNFPNVLSTAVYAIPRTVDIGLLKDNYVDATGQQNTLTPARNGNNPYWLLYNNKSGAVNNRIYGNAILSYKVAPWLTLSNNIGTDIYNEYRKAVTRPGTIGALTGNFFTANIYERIINDDFLATFNHKITSDLDMKFIAGTSVYETYYQRDQEDAQTLTVDKLYNFANAAAVTTTNTSNKKRIQGVYGDLTLSYKDFLYLEATGRNDWSSTLPKSHNSYFYPSVSAGFVFTDVLPKSTWLNYGKLRASYADVGGDTNPYALDFVYTPASSVFAQYGAGSTFPFNGLLGFTGPSTIPGLDKLVSQNQNSTEFGVDLRFLNDRITLDADLYKNTTKNQILSLPLPQSTGYAAKVINAGSLTNKGLEVTLGFVPVKIPSFNWNIQFRYSGNINTVSLPAEIKQVTVQSGYSGLTVKAENGKSIGLYGVAWVRDGNGHIVIDPATGLRKTITDQRLGGISPDYTGGITNTFNYKGLTLAFTVDIRKGGVLFSNTVSTLRTNGLSEETALNRGKIFVDPGVVASGTTFIPNTVPVQSMQDYWGQYSAGNTEANTFDASYVKLREAALSYTFPSSIYKRYANFIKGLSIGVEGRNLWLIHSNVPYIDPEVNFFGSGSAGSGVEFNSMPSTRSIGFNVRLTL